MPCLYHCQTVKFAAYRAEKHQEGSRVNGQGDRVSCHCDRNFCHCDRMRRNATPDARRPTHCHKIATTYSRITTRKRRGDIHAARMAGLNIRPPLGALTGTGVWGGAPTFPGTRAWPVEIPAAFRSSFRSYALSLPCEDRTRLGQAMKKAGLSLVSALAFHYLCCTKIGCGSAKPRRKRGPFTIFVARR